MGPGLYLKVKIAGTIQMTHGSDFVVVHRHVIIWPHSDRDNLWWRWQFIAHIVIYNIIKIIYICNSIIIQSIVRPWIGCWGQLLSCTIYLADIIIYMLHEYQKINLNVYHKSFCRYLVLMWTPEPFKYTLVILRTPNFPDWVPLSFYATLRWWWVFSKWNCGDPFWGNCILGRFP